MAVIKIGIELYELTYDEEKVVEPEFAMSREEYENFVVENLK